MTNKVTAKVNLYNVVKFDDDTVLYFSADYADGRNKEWAKYTPALSISMSVKHEVAEKYFVQGTAYTLTFEPEETND